MTTIPKGNGGINPQEPRKIHKTQQPLTEASEAKHSHAEAKRDTGSEMGQPPTPLPSPMRKGEARKNFVDRIGRFAEDYAYRQLPLKVPSIDKAIQHKIYDDVLDTFEITATEIPRTQGSDKTNKGNE